MERLEELPNLEELLNLEGLEELPMLESRSQKQRLPEQQQPDAEKAVPDQHQVEPGSELERQLKEDVVGSVELCRQCPSQCTLPMRKSHKSGDLDLKIQSPEQLEMQTVNTESPQGSAQLKTENARSACQSVPTNRESNNVSRRRPNNSVLEKQKSTGIFGSLKLAYTMAAYLVGDFGQFRHLLLLAKRPIGVMQWFYRWIVDF